MIRFHGAPCVISFAENKLFRDKRIPQVMISAFSRDPEGMGCVMTDLEPAFEKLAHQLRQSSITRVGVVCWHKEIDFFFRENPYVTYEASLRCRKVRFQL